MRIARGNTSLRRVSALSRESEIEFTLVRPLRRRVRRCEREAERAQNAESALDPIGPDGVRNRKEIATRVVSFVSFHGVIMKHGVGH
jgi:hypothetical protein